MTATEVFGLAVAAAIVLWTFWLLIVTVGP